MRERNALGLELAALRETPVTVTTPQREVVIVAGVNYPKFEKAGSSAKRTRKLSAGPWRGFALTLAQHRLTADPSLKVTLFDFLLGTQEDVTLSGGRTSTTVTKQFVAPSPDDYWHVSGVDLSAPTMSALLTAKLEPANVVKLRTTKPQVLFFDGVTAFAAGQRSVGLLDYVQNAAPSTPAISIVDVYDYLTRFRANGKANALAELHVFAHAYNLARGKVSGGPILLNSIDMNPLQATRHALDKDGRASKDFVAPTLNVSDLKAAFAADGRSFVWGCNFQRGFIRQFVHQLSKQRAELVAGRPVKMTWTSDWGDVGEFRTRLSLSSSASTSKVPLTKAQVLAVLTAANDLTYMKQLATASGRPVVGGPPGTYGDYDGPKSPLRLLHVPMKGDPFNNPKSTVNFLGALEVMRDQLGFTFDTSFGNHKNFGRGYIEYQP